MTILYIRTDSPEAHLTIQTDTNRYDYAWTAQRQLAKDLLSVLSAQLHTHEVALSDITGIVLFKGPGSFTGLRIGASVANALADSLQIPIVGALGDNWQATGLKRLQSAQNDTIVQLEYGGAIHITAPKK